VIGMHDAVIVSAVRTPVGKAPNGTLRGTRPDDMGAAVIAAALKRAPGVSERLITSNGSTSKEFQLQLGLVYRFGAGK